MYDIQILREILKGTLEFTYNLEPIYHKMCIFLTWIFVCDLRYIWVMTSWFLARQVPGGLAPSGSMAPVGIFLPKLGLVYFGTKTVR